MTRNETERHVTIHIQPHAKETRRGDTVSRGTPSSAARAACAAQCACRAAPTDTARAEEDGSCSRSCSRSTWGLLLIATCLNCPPPRPSCHQTDFRPESSRTSLSTCFPSPRSLSLGRSPCGGIQRTQKLWSAFYLSERWQSTLFQIFLC